jgi:GWxTD domain-containing protein
MRLFILFFLALFVSSGTFAGEKKLRVYLDTKQFYAPGLGHLLEVNLQFSGTSLNYKGTSNGLIADVAVFLSVEKNGVIVKEDAHRLESPLMRDSIIEDFYDLKRFVLEPGEYILHLEIKDLLSDAEAVKGSSKVSVIDVSSRTVISNIQIAEVANPGNESSMFHKSGYEIIPRLTNYFPPQLDRIPYYVEIYNTKLLGSTQFGIKQSIIDVETDQELEEFTTYYRMSCAEVVPVLKQIDISKLTTGQYYLQLTLLGEDMSEQHKEAYIFDRYKEIELEFDQSVTVLDPAFAESCSLDSAKFYIGSLIPISTPDIARKILSMIKNGTPDEAALLLQSFWKATSGAKAYEDWLKYKAQVQMVDRLYATNFQDGYETDRGRVYLQYGSPTTIVAKEASSSEYPYEIWQFNKIGRFSNKRFIFYNSDLIGNNYRILHSDMIGEVKNPNWPRDLNIRNTTNGNVDDGNAGLQEHWGGNSNTLFRQY